MEPTLPACSASLPVLRQPYCASLHIIISSCSVTRAANNATAAVTARRLGAIILPAARQTRSARSRSCRLPRAHVSARPGPRLRRQPQERRQAAKKASHLPPLSQTLAEAQPNDVLEMMCSMMCSNSTNCGHSCASARTNAGSGWLSAAGRAKLSLLSLMPSATVAKQRAPY